MTLSRREQVILTGFVLAILFGVLGMSLRKQLDAMEESRGQLGALRNQRASERSLIDSAPVWRERYEKVRDQMPVFPMDMPVHTFWAGRMDALAGKHGVTILRRTPGGEALLGDVYELPIDVREWEATLDGFLKFLHAMQSEGAMLDVRDLLIRPHPSRPTILRGSFTLYCAYMRAQTVEETE